MTHTYETYINRHSLFSLGPHCLQACPHRTVLDLADLETPLECAPDDEQTELIRKKGFEHEKQYVERLKRADFDVLEITRDEAESPDAQAARVVAALSQGADYVYQPYFKHGRFHGFADLLVRVDKPSKLGSFGYEIADTKISSTEKASYIVQLAFFSELLSAIQGSLPEHVQVILDSNRIHRYRLNDYFAYFSKLRDRFLAVVEAPESLGYPQPCDHCSICVWRNHCQARWERDEHLSLVANITRPGVGSLRSSISSKTQSRSTPPRAFSSIPRTGCIPKSARFSLIRSTRAGSWRPMRTQRRQ